MRTFFWLCLSLLVPGLLLRLDLGGSGVLGSDVLLPIFACSWLFHRGLVVRRFPPAPFLRSGFLFLGVAFLSFLFGAWDLDTKEQILSAAYLLRFFSLLIFAWAAVDLFRTNRDRDQLFTGIFWIVAIVVGFAFLQFFFLPDIGFLSVEGGWDPHSGRLLGTWMDPNFMAGLLGFIMPVLLGRWYDSTSWKSRYYLGVLVVILLGALFLTYSRSGYLAAGVGLLLFFALRDPKVILLGILLAAIGIVSNERAQVRVTELAGTTASIVLGDPREVDPTASLRLESWQKSLSLFEKHPIIGIGFNTYRYKAAAEGIVDESYFSAGGSDSTLITILVTTGILGFTVFLWFWIQLFGRSFFRYFREKQTTDLGIASGILAILIHSVFVNSLIFPLILLPIFAIYGGRFKNL